MARPLTSMAKRGMRASLEGFERIKAIDVVIFFVLMMMKLIIFDRFVDVPNMAMNVDDVFVALGTIGLVSFWTLLLPPRGRTVALVVLNLLLTFVIYADLIYFRYFQDLISVPVLLQAGQVGELGESISTLVSWADLSLFFDWPFIIAFAVSIFVRRRDEHDSAAAITVQAVRTGKRLIWRKMIFRVSLSLIVFATGLTLVFVPVNIAKKTWAAGLFSGNWWNLSLYNVTGVLGFHGYDAYKYTKENILHNETVPSERIAEAKEWFEQRGAVRGALESDPLFGAYKGSNVILIQLEAFQNFVIGRSINGQEVTPNMNKLVQESLYFDRFYHQTSGGRTSDADLAANISLQPLQSGSVFIRYAQNQFDSLPRTLKDNGYTPNAYHAYNGGFWNRNTMYNGMGYDYFYNKKDFAMDEPLGWSLGDTSFFSQSVSYMEKQKQPFYSFLISLSSHHPFEIPESYQTLDVGEFQGTIFGNYLEAAHYVDQSLGKMIEQLKAAGLWDTSIFMFYGDHDNSINDWAPFETFLGKKLNEVERYNILKQVPLVVHVPGGQLTGTHPEVGGQLDLAPTILHLLGISSKDKYMLGTPLVTEKPLADKRVVIRSGAYTDGNVWYFPSGDGLEENSRCLDATTGEPLDTGACPAGSDARLELVMSDLVIEHDLIREFRKRNP
ncbi:phosphoglycerol transferase MdoB-like AlkP superfamily enzyme [Paenibacillus phyllosphaerae]|uniref:Phosphoglycerol transferase MdoB-like AlkP superfamily enzyme n=1 Tax=Paenibacillus phyllosphaerae TaxID=274593 RepID=A0A7W5FMB7_9BACL|nr:LTA synthase family protein [Paenibacillus phyllosphaerae]MBB3109844.1 phosphoglycerol transferase MdoB-like AlkP superfamily enzyme [Paenibacillus phyllosphaerae]